MEGACVVPQFVISHNSFLQMQRQLRKSDKLSRHTGPMLGHKVHNPFDIKTKWTLLLWSLGSENSTSLHIPIV